MASDKKKTGYTLADKCRDEEDKLRDELAKQLKSDMKRLFTDRILTDLVIKAVNREFHVHKIIFQEMASNVYSEMMSLPGSSEDEGIIMLHADRDPERLKEILSSFYTDDDISSSVRELRKYLKTLPDEKIDEANLNRAAKPLETNSSGDKDIDENKDFSPKTDIANNSYVPETIENLKSDSDLINCQSLLETPQNAVTNADSVNNTNVAEMAVNLNTEKDFVNETNLVDNSANHESETESNAGNVENMENSAGKTDIVENTNVARTVDDCVRNLNAESEVSRIQVCEISTSELVKRELDLTSAPKACSVLGEDLLRKLASGVASDCVVSVGDWDFPAHRCMLAARSSYFAMMLNGSWIESDSEKIILEGVDASVVKQMLLYIYGGVLALDPGCSIGGLVMVADMYDVIGMKSIVSLILNKDYCHFFHKPCPGCIAGVPETLPLTMMYNMPDMCEKCLRWINKHREKVWEAKSFAVLPHECLDYCTQAAVKELNLLNIIDSLLECQRLNLKIPRVKWTTSILYCVATLMDSALEYASQNFVNIVSGGEFKQLDGKSLGFNMSTLEEIFSLIITSLAPGVACESYLTLHTLLTQIQNYIKQQEDNKKFRYDRFSEEYTELVEKLCKKCKEQLCLYIHQAVNTAEWFLLSKELQKDIMDEASYVCLDSPGRGKMAAKPKLTSMKKKPLSSEFRVSMKEYFDKHFGPKETFPSGAFKKTKSRLPQKADGTKKKDSTLPNKEVQRKSTSQAANQKTDFGGQGSKSTSRLKDGKTKSAKEKSGNATVTNLKRTVHDKNVTKSTTEFSSKTVPVSSKSSDVKVDNVMATGTKVKTYSVGDSASLSNLANSGSQLGKSSSKKQDSSRKETNKSLFANIRKEALTNASKTVTEESDSDSANHFGESEVGGAIPYMETVTRERSQSASSSSFRPHFGTAPTIQTSHSDDSFFGRERQGQKSIVRTMPTLDVQFVVPHEFYEKF